MQKSITVLTTVSHDHLFWQTISPCTSQVDMCFNQLRASANQIQVKLSHSNAFRDSYYPVPQQTHANILTTDVWEAAKGGQVLSWKDVMLQNENLSKTKVRDLSLILSVTITPLHNIHLLAVNNNTPPAQPSQLFAETSRPHTVPSPSLFALSVENCKPPVSRWMPATDKIMQKHLTANCRPILSTAYC